MKLINSLQMLGRLLCYTEGRMRRCNVLKKGKYWDLFQLREKLMCRVIDIETWAQNRIDYGVICDIIEHDEWMRQLQEGFGELLCV